MLFHHSTVALSAALILGATVGAATNVNLTELFGPHLSSKVEIFLPSQAGYSNQVPGRWTVWHEPTFFGTIKPATEQDLQAIVSIATCEHIPFLAVRSGHGYSAKDTEQRNVLQVDLQNFNSINIDAANNRMTIGGGVVFEDAISALYSAGKEITVGNAACVGFNGAAIGAGIGTLQGLHGFTADSLVSVRMVTASGDLVTVSRTEHPDLFWAIRGAGANFGIITSATYNIYNATNGGEAVSANFIFLPAANRSLFEYLESFDDGIPASLSVSIAITYNQTSKTPAILANLVNHGPQSEIQAYIDGLKALKPVVSLVKTVPWTGLDKALFFGVPSAGNCKNGTYNNLYAMGLNRTDPATLETYFADFSAFSAKNPTYMGAVTIQRYSAAKVIENADSGGVYPWRQIKSHMLFSNTYPNSSLDGAVDGFMRSARAKLQSTSGFATPAVYINYAHGDEGPATWYGAHNLPRLMALKLKWDPENVFTGPHPLIDRCE